MFRPLWQVLTCLVLTGCGSLVTVERHEYYRDGEGIFQRTLLEAIKPGVTDAQYLDLHFGQPLSFQAGPDNSSLSTWQFSRLRQKSTQVFGLVRLRDMNEQRRYLHVVLRDGLVVKYWHDHQIQVDGDRIFSALGIVAEEAHTPTTAPSSDAL